VSKTLVCSVRRASAIVALIATALLATAGITANTPEAQTTTAQVAREVSNWPIHVALAAVAIAAVWMALYFGQKKDELALERDKMNAAAMGKLTDSMIALRDVEAERHQAMARLSAAIEGRPCLCGATHKSTHSHGKGPHHEQPQPTV
jgi:hypothetical protein